MLTVLVKKSMLVNSIKIGIAAGALAVAALTVTTPERDSLSDVRIPDSIDQNSPVSLQMYNYIKQYADTFDIPLRYAFGVANTETGYRGPFHWRYNPAQTSSAGAVGPMQVMVSTARWINKDNVSKETLKTDIKYNIYTSMKLLRILFDKNQNWKIAFGEYNTGRPCINGYSHKVYNYEPNW
jgi:soluble lytic murein transglycosylase-like protein